MLLTIDTPLFNAGIDMPEPAFYGLLCLVDLLITFRFIVTQWR